MNFLHGGHAAGRRHGCLSTLAIACNQKCCIVGRPLGADKALEVTKMLKSEVILRSGPGPALVLGHSSTGLSCALDMCLGKLPGHVSLQVTTS